MLIINLIQEYYLILKHKVVGYHKPIPGYYKRGDKGDIVMIIGINGIWTSLKTIADHFNKQGYRIHFPEFKTRDPIPKIVEVISSYIDNNQLENFFIVAHSKGGLVSRVLLEEYHNKMLKVITISTPNYGSIFGYLQKISLKEIKPESKLLKKIHSYKTDKIINIYPTFDNLVIPYSSLILENGKNIQLNIIGHTRILESKELLNELDKIL